ncbi:MAG: hypothetical protein HN348_05325 [Proteobacteria bacterium]|nr:hypothetical protein [Pseudomonadota bacterium]
MFSSATLCRACLIVAVAASIATTDSDDITDAYVTQSLTSPEELFSWESYIQTFEISADADNFAFDSSFNSKVEVKLYLDAKSASDIPILMRLSRDHIVIDEVSTNLSLELKHSLIDDVGLTDCQVGLSCSHMYMVEVYNQSEESFDLEMTINGSLTNLDGVSDHPNLDIDFF